MTEQIGIIATREATVSRLERAIRNKRYRPKDGISVSLVVESPTGSQISLDVIDCSANGLRAKGPKDQILANLVNTSMIVPSSKITSSKGEFFLGRLIPRRVLENGVSAEVAFSLIDGKVPVDGALSHSLEVDLSKPALKEELSSDKFSVAHFVESEYANVDLFDRLRKFDVFFQEWSTSDKYAYYTVREASKGPRVNLARVRKNGRRDYLVMASNDYLGLASHPEVIEAGKKAFDQYGFSSTGSPVTTGITDLHEQLCNQIANMHGKEAAVLYNSGYAANIGAISSITTTNDLVVADQLCHASIQDAMGMAKSTPRFFRHNRAEHLDQILTKERSKFNGCLVVTEGVFSMDGDVAKLDEIYDVARSHNARIYVDQAHCFGVLGPSGLGVADKFHLMREVDIIMGTFSKICGGIGGFITGSRELINWLHVNSRAHLFSVSLPPASVAAVSKSLEIFQRDKSLTETLRRNISHFTQNLRSLGFQVDKNHESAVVPVLIGDDAKMGVMYQSLLDDGVWCVPIVYPAVSRKQGRFRFTVMATHTLSDLDYAASCLEKAAMKANFIPGGDGSTDKED